MPFHLLDLDEPIEPALVDDLFQSTDPLGLCEEYSEWGLKISRESRKYIGLDADRFEIVDRSIHTQGVVSEIFIPHSYLATFCEKGMEISNTGIFDIEILLRCQSPHDDECSGFYIVSNHSPFCFFLKRWNAYDGYGVVVSDGNLSSMSIEKIYEARHMWFYGGEKYMRRPVSLDIGEYETLGGSNRESSGEFHIPIFRLSRNRYSGVSICSGISDLEETVHKNIDRSFSYITSTRIWKLHGAEGTQKSGHQQYTRTDLTGKLEINILIVHSARIDGKRMIVESDLHSGTFRDGKKRVYITDIRDIMDNGLFKKKGSTDHRKGGVLGSAYLHASGKCLSSGDFKHMER